MQIRPADSPTSGTAPAGSGAVPASQLWWSLIVWSFWALISFDWLGLKRTFGVDHCREAGGFGVVLEDIAIGINGGLHAFSGELVELVNLAVRVRREAIQKRLRVERFADEVERIGAVVELIPLVGWGGAGGGGFVELRFVGLEPVRLVGLICLFHGYWLVGVGVGLGLVKSKNGQSRRHQSRYG